MRAEELLPDHMNQADFNGVTVRKGTVGAFVFNARVWTDSSAGTPARATAQRDIVNALPALRALGIVEVMEIRDAALRALIDTH